MDVDDLNNIHDLKQNIQQSKAVLLLITQDVFTSEYVRMEIVTAFQAKKKIILVHDEKISIPAFSTIEHHFSTQEEKEIFQQILTIKSIPFHKQKEFRETSLQLILNSLVTTT